MGQKGIPDVLQDQRRDQFLQLSSQESCCGISGFSHAVRQVHDAKCIQFLVCRKDLERNRDECDHSAPVSSACRARGFSISRNEKRKNGRLLVLFVAYVMAVHVPILAQARYSIPLISVIAILASAGLATVLKKSETRIQSPAAA